MRLPNPLPAHLMSRDERLAEVTRLLALGLIRLRAPAVKSSI